MVHQVEIVVTGSRTVEMSDELEKAINKYQGCSPPYRLISHSMAFTPINGVPIFTLVWEVGEPVTENQVLPGARKWPLP